MCSCFNDIVSFFPPCPLTLRLLLGWGESLVDCVSFQKRKQTKDKNVLAFCSYCMHEHPPTVSFSQWTGSNIHHITNYCSSIKWFNHSVLVIMQNWQKIFLLFSEIANTPLGELNKGMVLRGMLRNLTNENNRQQKSAHVQRTVLQALPLYFQKLPSPMINKILMYFLMYFSYGMMCFSRYICGCSGFFFLQKSES